jgi:hypothetical protein
MISGLLNSRRSALFETDDTFFRLYFAMVKCLRWKREALRE